MKVGFRITVATCALAALLIIGLAYTVNHTRQSERSADLEMQTKRIAQTLRTSFESQDINKIMIDRDRVERAFSKKDKPWSVSIHPLSARGNDELSRRLLSLKEPSVIKWEPNAIRYALPLRASSSQQPEGHHIVGAVVVTHSVLALVQKAKEDTQRAIWMVCLALLLTFVAVGGLVRRSISRPLEKLLQGIDDVTKGDLSRVLLSERDDEIGKLAIRFSDMTTSLREAQAETRRQNDAKLHLEQRLRQTETMATVGQMAAEIAHEVGTPLHVIAGRSRNILRQQEPNLDIKRNAEIISEQTARITRIIERLLDVTRRRVGKKEPGLVDLNEICRTTLELLDGRCRNANIQTTLTPHNTLPKIVGDTDHFYQLLLNLMVNAVQAMPAGGTLEVTTMTITTHRPGLALAPKAQFACVRIGDTGTGISKEAKKRIFDPFYTSKPSAEGTGLGLSVCQGVVKQYDGWIEVTDNTKCGTNFTVYVPTNPETILPKENNKPTSSHLDTVTKDMTTARQKQVTETVPQRATE